jgi:alpha-pyrone synthase
MSYILDISTAVPAYSVSNEELIQFYAKALQASGENEITMKLTYLVSKTRIANRHTCISDFNGQIQELFKNGNYKPSVEQRMNIYAEKIMPLAARAIDPLFLKNKIKPHTITHLITVSCTGLVAPGLEFLVAEYLDLQQAEKVALNFLGCYAAIKAIKHAHYIAQADTEACILIVCAELCSLHFYPSAADEDILSNLLFTDGAAALIVCGDAFDAAENKTILKINAIGSASIPNTLQMMTWNISSSAFRMYLSRQVVDEIKENIAPAVHNFLQENNREVEYWAIHPGGVRIVEAVKESLHLNDSDVADSLEVLHQHGNMSSPTILFILKRLLHKIAAGKRSGNKEIVTCAFGPGLTMEMVHLTAVQSIPFTKKNAINLIKSWI